MAARYSNDDDHSSWSGEIASSAINAIPTNTSVWTENVLDLFRIKINRQKLYSPLELFDSWIPSVLSNKFATCISVDKRARNIITHLNKHNPFNRLDFKSIYDMEPLYEFLESNDGGCSRWTSTMPSLVGEEHWNHMFESGADMFSKHLKYMISIHEEGKSVAESLYLKLFQDFIGMFGLDCTSHVLPETIGIQKVNVSSTPDILLMDNFQKREDTDGIFCMKILVLVKRVESDIACISPPDIQNRKDNVPNEELNMCRDFIISENIIAQHCGELLSHCHRSSDRNGLLGIILEKTNITFTYLQCSKEQFELIKAGKKCHFENCPSVLFSRKYNYLKSDDREELIEPLVKLSLLQSIT